MSKKEKDKKNKPADILEANPHEHPEEKETIETPATEEKITVEEQLKKELSAEKDKFIRLFADFENYKKRIAKERIELFKTAGQDVILSMLPVLDDFERALTLLSKSEDKEMVKGIELISHKFREVLKSKGLIAIEVAQGTAFDAEIHEAITQIPAPAEELKGKIIDVTEKGYQLGEKIIRYPKVVVGQ
jgi:molecular chaperone GrpE